MFRMEAEDEERIPLTLAPVQQFPARRGKKKPFLDANEFILRALGGAQRGSGRNTYDSTKLNTSSVARLYTFCVCLPSSFSF